MRISDWSSDVCSSDLNCAPVNPRRRSRLEPTYGESCGTKLLAQRAGRLLTSPPAFPNILPSEQLTVKESTCRENRGFGMQQRSIRSEEHTSELQSLMRNSYAVFCLTKKNKHKIT